MANEPELVTTAQAVATDYVHMQIVAHQDDDLLFMSPDLRNAIAAGHGIVTVYLTAGQASGAPGMCAAEFAASRQLGEMAAYAHMAFPTHSNPASLTWYRDLIVPDAGVPWPHTAELFTLAADPRIRLIFLNIPDGGSSIGLCNYFPYANALANMHDDPSYVTDTIVPDCGLAQGYGNSVTNCGEWWYPNPFVCNSFQGCSPTVPWQNYDHAGVIAVLNGLINTYQPIVVRTLDPQPFLVPGEVANDNTDHTAAARFANEALASYHGPNGTARYSVNHYRGYLIEKYPANLGVVDTTTKQDTIVQYYVPRDPNYQNNLGGYTVWYERMLEKYPASTTWLERASDGRLVAISVEDRQVKMWFENSVAGTWTGPTTIPTTTPIAPSIALVKRPDGKLQIFAMRLPLQRETWNPIPSSAPQQEIITSIQNPGTTIAFGAWQSVGVPGPGELNGMFTATIDGTGRAFVFAKNSEGRLAYTYSIGTTWAAWNLVTATAEDILDGIAAITGDNGVVEVFATARSGQIQHYIQNGTSFSDATASFNFSASSAPTATKNQDGRLQIFYREIANAQPNANARTITAWVNTSGQWVGGVTGGGILWGDAGTGPIAAIRRGGSGHIMLFERNVDGRVSGTWQQAINSSFYLQWLVLGGPGDGQLIHDFPAAATDNGGRVVVVAKASNGKLYIKRESRKQSLGSFGAWIQVGN